MYWRWGLSHAGVSFTSSSVDTGQETGTDTWRAAHLRGGKYWNNKSFGLCLPPHICHTFPVSGVGDVGLLACLMFSLWLYFMNVLSHHLPLTWELPGRLIAPGYSLPRLSSCAITLKCIGECSWTTTNQGLQKGCIFFNLVVPHSSSLPCTGSEPRVPFLAVTLTYWERHS